MIRWTQLAARSAMLTLTVVCAAAAAPLAAQQTQNDQAITATAPQTSAPAVTATSEASTPATTQAAGPRVNRMDRVEPKLNTPTRFAAQENVNVNNSYLIYILVAAVLVVLLIFLIKRA